jgi:uncharacterized membrane protein
VTGNLLVFLGAALASAVEMVETLTIVLALGVSRGWRAPLQGAAAAIAVLVVLVAALGPALEATLLEGLEVAFIVITLGANQGATAVAAAGAVVAFVVVVAAGAAVRHPLSRVPENTLKLLVGVMLTSFGTFWAGEGVGIDWPGGDGALGVLIVLTAAWSWVFIRLLSRQPRAVTA